MERKKLEKNLSKDGTGQLQVQKVQGNRCEIGFWTPQGSCSHELTAAVNAHMGSAQLLFQRESGRNP